MEKQFFSQISSLPFLDCSNSSCTDVEWWIWHHHVNNCSSLFIFPQGCWVILLRSTCFYEGLSAGGQALHVSFEICSVLAHGGYFPRDWEDNQHCRKNEGKTCLRSLKSKEKIFPAWNSLQTSTCLIFI